MWAHRFLSSVVTKNYQTIVDSDRVIGDAAVGLASLKLDQTLESFYLNNKFDAKVFTKTIDKYDFRLNDEIIAAIKLGLRKQLPRKTIIKKFMDNRSLFLLTLKVYFLKYMKERNFPFPLSSKLWSEMYILWNDKKKPPTCSPNEFFKVKLDDFEDHLAHFAGSILYFDSKPEMIAVLWGSVYI